MELTSRQEKFVQGLFRGLSQRQSYKESYNCNEWKDESIDSRASELANNSKIVARLTELRANVTKESSWTVERLIKEFEQCKKKCMQEVEVMKFDPEQGMMVGTGEYKFEYSGVIKSLENIGKLLGMYETKLKHSGEVTIHIDIEDKDDD